MNRSQVPRGVMKVKPYPKIHSGRGKSSNDHMKFKSGRTKRPDTGKKITKDKSYH